MSTAPRAPRGAAARTLSARELRRLHFINTLFSHITGHDLYLAAQIKEAIAFSLEELAEKTATLANGAHAGGEAGISVTRQAQEPPPTCTDGATAALSPASKQEAQHTPGGEPAHAFGQEPVDRPRQDKGIEDALFYEEAARLLKTAFARHFPERGFYHWDAAQSLASVTPLFARDEILTGLRHLSAYRESTLLITHLRPALIPAPKRATARRIGEYRELVDFIRQLAASHSAPDSRLQLLFL
ncbi:hypothetical protein AXK11_02230 [Cephaloticoccus primus]|uniref:Uncharacterized protein n=1 Tax=Cephaloticoccus primus TaxID=1548207 RepID=A0A139SST4_9BACT|nr:hypothetical protein [Cephaloticoccus primus]KXU37531.1 hypothetical protein AXK11_02230 [Cephaloticoccus primus]